MKKILLSTSILTLLIALAFVGSAPRAFAAPTLSVDPPMVSDTLLTPGSTFDVNVTIADILNLYGYEFKVGYDTTVLTATAIVLGPFFPSNAIVGANEVDDTTGFAWFSATMPFGAPTVKTGSGVLATITFSVDALGSSYLTLYDDLLGDPYVNVLFHLTSHGYFSNVAVAFEANIIQRSAWPEAHHYVVANDALPTGDGLITLYAKLSNIGTVATLAKVVFKMFDENGVPLPGDPPESSPSILKAGETVVVTADWGGFLAGNKYHVSAQAMYDSNGDLIIDAAGTKVKAFAFAVVP